MALGQYFWQLRSAGTRIPREITRRTLKPERPAGTGGPGVVFLYSVPPSPPLAAWLRPPRPRPRLLKSPLVV
jgi:hypothetical protein